MKNTNRRNLSKKNHIPFDNKVPSKQYKTAAHLIMTTAGAVGQIQAVETRSFGHSVHFKMHESTHHTIDLTPSTLLTKTERGYILLFNMHRLPNKHTVTSTRTTGPTHHAALTLYGSAT